MTDPFIAQLQALYRARHACQLGVRVVACTADDARLIDGVIDLLFANELGWHIRDYKTDLMLDAGNYEYQLVSYRSTLESVGLAVADAITIPARVVGLGG